MCSSTNPPQPWPRTTGKKVRYLLHALYPAKKRGMSSKSVTQEYTQNFVRPQFNEDENLPFSTFSSAAMDAVDNWLWNSDLPGRHFST
jgi:hypothetical protein